MISDIDAATQLHKARDIIIEELEKSGVRVLRVLLFGSRARGDFRPDSDFDFYVVVDKELLFPERQEMTSRIRWMLARAGITGDVVIQSEDKFAQGMANTGYLAYYVAKEGIEI